MATFCLLHGDWHDGSRWDPLVEELRARGHEAEAPDLPYGDPKAGFEQRIQPAVEALEGVSGPVVVVGHSVSSGYAALVAVGRPGSLLVHLCPRLGRADRDSGRPLPDGRRPKGARGPARPAGARARGVARPGVTQPAVRAGLARAAPFVCTRSKTRRTAIEPSPIAAATRLIERLRTSPTQKTPGRLVSSTSGSIPCR
ncbi:MAG: hypothetical protein QOH11_1141 [Solirubrobacteraceae bacterium]|nr:hypothetical protein [Solirubrobacteraceae bacterium]